MESIKKRKRIICATAIALIVLAIAYVWYWRSQPSGENLNYAYPESIESVRDLTPILSDLINKIIKSIHAHSYHSKLYDKPILNYMEWAVDETDALRIAEQMVTSVDSAWVALFYGLENPPCWSVSITDRSSRVKKSVYIDPATGEILEIDTSELKDR